MTAGEILWKSAPPKGVVAVVGCGGKTTWIGQMAQELRAQKVLISPTTKIYPMAELGDSYQDTLEGALSHKPHKGIQCLGIEKPEVGKLGALPLDTLGKLVEDYDVSLLEADGSRGLPCKGWRAWEPVIPNFVTHTVGIFTFGGIHKTVSPETVLGVSQFTAITGLQEGDTITLDALEKMAVAMMTPAVGQRFLFLNETGAKAQGWLEDFAQQYPKLGSKLAYGSAKDNVWNEV